MFSSPTSRWTGGTVAVCLGLVAVSYVTLVGPKRGEASDLEQATATAEQQNDDLQLRTAQLKAQFATLPQRQAELGTMLGQVPVTADVPRFVRSLDGLAASTGVTLDTVTPSAAQVLDANGALVGGGAATGAASGPAASAASGPAASAASGAAAGTGAGATIAAGGASGAAQVVAVPITVTVHGPYFKAVSFLKDLQSGQRAFLVTGLQVAVAGSDVTLTVKGRIFAVPGAAAALTALTSAAPTTAPQQSR
ncbi:MAG: hypothetical protein ACXV3A_07540 [Kineosporiaceae bacterium]